MGTLCSCVKGIVILDTPKNFSGNILVLAKGLNIPAYIKQGYVVVKIPSTWTLSRTVFQLDLYAIFDTEHGEKIIRFSRPGFYKITSAGPDGVVLWNYKDKKYGTEIEG